MVKLLQRVYVTALIAAGSMVPGLVSADPGAAAMRGGYETMPPHHATLAGIPTLSAGWQETLTDEQKSEIDWLDLKSHQKQQLISARISVSEIELNQLVTGEDVSDEQLQNKVDELLGLQRDYWLNKYQHIIEIRQILTPQQRVSFDSGLLSHY